MATECFTSKDWLTSVIIPLFMTIAVGGWVGLVCTRIMIFFQARYRLSSDIYAAFIPLKAAETPTQVVLALAYALNPATAEFAALGHVKVVKEINRLCRRSAEKAAELCAVTSEPVNYPALPELHGEAFQKFREDFINGFYTVNVGEASRRIHELRPNWWPLLTPNPFPKFKHATDVIKNLRF